MRRTRLNTAYFAQTVTYWQGDRELSIDVHARHRIRIARDDRGNEDVIEQLLVEIDRDDVPSSPAFGDSIIVAGDSAENAYLYAWTGRKTPVSYKATFERERKTSAGVPE